MASVGSLEWGRETGGVLSDEDRNDLLAQTQAVLERLQTGVTLSAVSLDEIALPDSRLAKDAEDLCREVSEPWLFGHCARTYLFGAAWGIGARVAFDAEVLYVAALLHDLFVTQTLEPTMSVECFAVAGALYAQEFTTTRDSKERATRVAEAISRHLNVDVPIADGAESHLLSIAVTIDVSGLYVDQLPSGLVPAIVARHPRTGSASGISAVIKRQAELHPQARAGFLHSVVGLTDRALENPLGD